MYTMEIRSRAFKEQELIPMKYTCNGDDISPPLEWSRVPEEAKSLVLICDDPDAPMGTWDHWVLFNLPPELEGLEEGVKDFPEETKFGRNSWGNDDFGGPCPPDKEHRYYFKLYALDGMLDLESGSSKQEVEEAMKGHIMAEAQLMGRYDQPR